MNNGKAFSGTLTEVTARFKRNKITPLVDYVGAEVDVIYPLHMASSALIVVDNHRFITSAVKSFVIDGDTLTIETMNSKYVIIKDYVYLKEGDI